MAGILVSDVGASAALKVGEAVVAAFYWEPESTVFWWDKDGHHAASVTFLRSEDPGYEKSLVDALVGFCDDVDKASAFAKEERRKAEAELEAAVPESPK